MVTMTSRLNFSIVIHFHLLKKSTTIRQWHFHKIIGYVSNIFPTFEHRFISMNFGFFGSQILTITILRVFFPIVAQCLPFAKKLFPPDFRFSSRTWLFLSLSVMYFAICFFSFSSLRIFQVDFTRFDSDQHKDLFFLFSFQPWGTKRNARDGTTKTELRLSRQG